MSYIIPQISYISNSYFILVFTTLDALIFSSSAILAFSWSCLFAIWSFKSFSKSIQVLSKFVTVANITEQFGLGFGLETDKNDYQSIYSLGTFSWGGAFSTSYWADPQEKLIGLIYTNVLSSPYRNMNEKVKVLIYQAIVD